MPEAATVKFAVPPGQIVAAAGCCVIVGGGVDGVTVMVQVISGPNQVTPSRTSLNFSVYVPGGRRGLQDEGEAADLPVGDVGLVHLARAAAAGPVRQCCRTGWSGPAAPGCPDMSAPCIQWPVPVLLNSAQAVAVDAGHHAGGVGLGAVGGRPARRRIGSRVDEALGTC